MRGERIMGDRKRGWTFINNEGEFVIDNPQKTSYLYFPLANEAGMMSSITPTLHGDIKTSQNTFLMAPASPEELHNSRAARNFWIFVEGYGAWSASGNSPRQAVQNFEDDDNETARLEVGFLYHKITRENKALGLRAEIINFVPVNEDKVELMKVTITNFKNEALRFTPTAAIPLYGRSADNIRDHRHVTSLLHRITTNTYGIAVKPSLSFDERGHKLNNVVYSVQGSEELGEAPVGFFPVTEDYIGEGGSLEWPETIVKNLNNYCNAGESFEGFEAVGALRFKDAVIEPGKSKSFIIVMSISEESHDLERLSSKYCLEKSFNIEFERNKSYWKARLDKLSINSGDEIFNGWIKWVTLQPMLRRIYGCSFMPHHDYGRGGRGWRDLWQDCLALLIMNPKEVRELLYNNYAGVRIDGSNATIIGSKPGEFIADRNNIARIWMDHGVWPFLTTKLYIDQSGDLDFLLENQLYFKDKTINRASDVDTNWKAEEGNKLKTQNGLLYEGTILEHILIENLTPFYNVGEHNNIRLEGADWNDGLDMAAEKGESVAFTAFYGSNLIELGKLLKALKDLRGVEKVQIAEEMLILLDTLNEKIDYSCVSEKHNILNKYYNSCRSNVSGEKITVSIDALSKDLDEKGRFIINHIRSNEWIKDREGFEWFNGYYDNAGNRVEGDHENGVRMILTSQVFTTMSGAATDEQVEKIVASANKYLMDSKVGGYRLNTNFHEVKLNMGRLFGFAYGHKENGAMFSHMAVMYANALYQRGFVSEGHAVVESIYKHCADFEKSRIYPGVPEYINEKGRGMYHYLTGSASWLLLTVLNEVYGVKGSLGDLVLQPKLMISQLDDALEAKITTIFAGRKLNIVYRNNSKLNYKEYKIGSIKVDNNKIQLENMTGRAVIGRTVIEALGEDEEHEVLVELI
jgi:cellobiose phosphorylase